MDFILVALVVGSVAAWLTAEPVGLAVGVKGAATQAFADGWSAGSSSAARRWKAGEADRTGRRKKRHKRWRQSRKGRALIAADNTGRATVGAAVRGIRLTAPVVADTIRAGSGGARQGWTASRAQREERKRRERKRRADKKRRRIAKKRQPAADAPQGGTEVDPSRIEWARLGRPLILPEPVPESGTTRCTCCGGDHGRAMRPGEHCTWCRNPLCGIEVPPPVTPDPMRPEMTDPTADRTCWRRGCDQPGGDSGVCAEHRPVDVTCPHCGRTQLVRPERADDARRSMADGCPRRPGGPGSTEAAPSTDTPAPAGTTQGGPPMAAEIANHTDLQKELQNKLEALESLIADIKQMIAAAAEEAEATVKQAQGYAEALEGGRFGEIVHKAISAVTEAAGAVLKQVTAMREAGDGFEKSTGELGDAISGAEKETVAAVGA